MFLNQFEFEINGHKYPVFVESKRQKNIYFRFKKNAFYVTCPILTSKKKIIQGLEKFGQKLIKKTQKNNVEHFSFEKNHIFLFGKKFELRIADKFNIQENTVFLKDSQDLEKNLRRLLLNYLNESVRKYEREMGIEEPYQISVKKMSSRYGSNSKQTHRLHFQFDLVHYSPEIIDSVVVHELAHHFYRNHQQRFYSCVLEYCPEYYSLKKKLRNKIHS